MGFLDTGEPEERVGQAQQPPATKFTQLYSTINNMLENSDTVGLTETGLLKLKSYFDESEPMNDVDSQNLEKQIPGLTIPQGTKTNTAWAMTRLKIRSNLQKAIAEDPNDNTAVSWAGKATGTFARVLDPVDNAIALPLTGGASLVSKAVLPEFISSLRLLPESIRPFVESGALGSVYGGSLDVTSGEVQAAKKKELTGLITPTSDIVKNAINDVPTNFAGGVALYGVGRIIGKGIGLVGKGLRRADEADVIQSNRTAPEATNLQQFLEKRQAEIEADKGALQEKVGAIRANTKEASEANVPKGDDIIDNVVQSNKEALGKAKSKFPDLKQLDSLSSEVDEISASNEEHNVKSQALGAINEKLRLFSSTHDGAIDQQVLDVAKNLNDYNNQLSIGQPNPDANSAENILNDFRMTTPEDYGRFKQVALAQMEAGRDVELTPYINDAVANNSEKLINRLEDAGVDREQTLHATLDSLDVVKDDQAQIENNIAELSERIKAIEDPDNRAKLRGRINGQKNLLRVKTDQRAVHEVIAAALSNEFRSTPKVALKDFLLNQVSKDADFKGGYQRFQNQLLNDEKLEALEEKPEPITEEGKEETAAASTRKNLVKKMVQDGFNCLTGN